MEEYFTPAQKLNKDLKEASRVMGKQDMRFLVDMYYLIQNNRIRSGNQLRAMSDGQEPHEVVRWVFDMMKSIEEGVKKSLDINTSQAEIGKWARSNYGIGPVITAGLLAHIDIHKAPTAGHIWSFAGISGSPDKKWKKGQKRPFNARLKTLCWKVGESFVKVSGKEDAYYGKLYKELKATEEAKNQNGLNAAAAAQKLIDFNIGKSTDAYKAYSAGKLPPAHVHARAKRRTVKVFLSHLWEKWRTLEGLPVCDPYAIEHLGHAHKLIPPEGDGDLVGDEVLDDKDVLRILDSNEDFLDEGDQK